MNSSTASTKGPTPLHCNLYPQPRLTPFISDIHLSIVFPTVVYVVLGGLFHIVDAYQLFDRYKIHPSEEELKRNHVSRWDCLKQVVTYHAMQIVIGVALSWGEGPMLIGDEACKIADWIPTISYARGLLVTALAMAGVDARSGTGTATDNPKAWLNMLPANILPTTPTQIDASLAKAVFYVGIPVVQYIVALAVLDTYIYFAHRLCHFNKTLYRIVHARHHHLYVSYAYGSVYGHPFESLFLDIFSFVLANAITHLTPRQNMVFGSLAVYKTISDHCGYVFPYDPFSYLNGNGARFHDLHHQSWGLKQLQHLYYFLGSGLWYAMGGRRWGEEEV